MFLKEVDMAKICQFCGNKNFKSVTVEYTYKKNNQLLMVKNVPCEQCEYCGEQYFRADILKEIEQEFNDIYSGGKKPFLEIRVPIQNFADIRKAS